MFGTNFMFYFIFLLPIIIESIEDQNDKLIGRLHSKKKGEKLLMEKMLQALVGKYCMVKALKGEYVGMVMEIDGNGLILKNKEISQVVNLDFIISVKELPLNRKGKPKVISNITM